jgi:SAM-dependent methyltransferase
LSFAYKLLYGVGFTPWEQMAKSPLITEQISALFDREEAGREPPYRRALDLGCGRGIWAVKLADRGWQVTGVDFVSKALRRGRQRAAEAGVDLQLVEGDVTALASAGVGSGFQLLVDFGCFHDELSDEQRAEEGREATAAAAPDATLLLMAWAPGRRGPLPRGASREDIADRLPRVEGHGRASHERFGSTQICEKSRPALLPTPAKLTHPTFARSRRVESRCCFRGERHSWQSRSGGHWESTRASAEARSHARLMTNLGQGDGRLEDALELGEVVVHRPGRRTDTELGRVLAGEDLQFVMDVPAR